MGIPFGFFFNPFGPNLWGVYTCRYFQCPTLTLHVIISVYTPHKAEPKGLKKNPKGISHAEVTHKTKTKGQANRMFLHRDNHMQSQSGTLKISASVHAP